MNKVGIQRQPLIAYAADASNRKRQASAANLAGEHFDHWRREYFKVVRNSQLQAQIVQPKHHFVESGDIQDFSNTYHCGCHFDKRDCPGAAANQPHKSSRFRCCVKSWQHKDFRA
jgi:hypothetical protein